MSVPNNNIVREIARKSVFANIEGLLSVAISFNQGDILCLKAGLVQKPSADADTVNHLGVAPVTVVDGKLKSPYIGVDTDAAELPGQLPGPVYGVECAFDLNVGDAFNPGDLVYAVVATPQLVTVTQPAGAEAIGVYVGRAFASAAAGDQGDVHVGAQFPALALSL